MKRLAQEHPIVTFLLTNFAWTWLFWLGAIPLRGRDDLLLTAIVMIGGFGPALAGILTLGLRSGQGFTLHRKQIITMIIACVTLLTVMALRYCAGNIPAFSTLAETLALSAPIVIAVIVTSLVGGWVISSAVSNNTEIRDRMASILPQQLPFGWTVLGLFFYTGLILAGWGLAILVGSEVEYPSLWGQPALQVLPLYALTFGLTALAQGGNEEPGWRGFLQPELQKRFSPLGAALIVSLFWSLWHLPLYLNGFYPGDLVGGMIGSGIFRILLAVFLAWFYNGSGGNLFLTVFLHTCFNVLVNFLPTSDLGLLVLWLVVDIIVVVKDKMYYRVPDRDSSPIAASFRKSGIC